MDIRATIFGGSCWRNNIIQGCICFHLFIYLFFWQFNVGLFKKKKKHKTKKTKNRLCPSFYTNGKSISTQAPPTPRGTKWVIVLDMTYLGSRNESANEIMEMRNHDSQVKRMTFEFWAIRSGLAHHSRRRATIPREINLRWEMPVFIHLKEELVTSVHKNF